jgi:hypothetical protein
VNYGRSVLERNRVNGERLGQGMIKYVQRGGRPHLTRWRLPVVVGQEFDDDGLTPRRRRALGNNGYIGAQFVLGRVLHRPDAVACSSCRIFGGDSGNPSSFVGANQKEDAYRGRSNERPSENHQPEGVARESVVRRRLRGATRWLFSDGGFLLGLAGAAIYGGFVWLLYGRRDKEEESKDAYHD